MDVHSWLMLVISKQIPTIPPTSLAKPLFIHISYVYIYIYIESTGGHE